MVLRKTLPVMTVLVLGAGVGVAHAHDATTTEQSSEPPAPVMGSAAAQEPPAQAPAADAVPAEEHAPPTRAPAPDEKVTIADGKGGERTDMTYDEFLSETQRLEEANPSKSGQMQLYGLLENGEIGVTAVCDEIPFDELGEADQQRLLELLPVPPDSVHNCGEAPGVEWPTD